MKILIGADKDGFELKECLKKYLSNKHEIIDKTPENKYDFVESSTLVAKAILANEGDRGILIDKYGAGSFISANKFKNIICAEVSDEHSAYMTRSHNNTSIIALGQSLVGEQLAKDIVDVYIAEEYAGGRHQIRIDMLDKML